MSTWTWTQQTSAGQFQAYDIASSTNGGVLVMAVNVSTDNRHGLWNSTDYGATWSNRSGSGHPWYTCDIDGAGTYGICGSTDAILGQTANGGGTWAFQGSGNLTGTVLASASPNRAYACLPGNTTYYNNSYGNAGAWSASNTPNGYDWQSIDCSADGTRVVACAANLDIYISNDSGVTYTAAGMGALSWINVSVSQIDPNYIVAISYTGYVWRSTNGGTSWSSCTSLGTAPWNCCWTNGSSIIVGGVNTYLYVSEDFGSTWSAMTAAGQPHWTSVSATSDFGRLFAVALGPDYVWTAVKNVILTTSKFFALF